MEIFQGNAELESTIYMKPDETPNILLFWKTFSHLPKSDLTCGGYQVGVGGFTFAVLIRQFARA